MSASLRILCSARAPVLQFWAQMHNGFFNFLSFSDEMLRTKVTPPNGGRASKKCNPLRRIMFLAIRECALCRLYLTTKARHESASLDNMLPFFQRQNTPTSVIQRSIVRFRVCPPKTPLNATGKYIKNPQDGKGPFRIYIDHVIPDAWRIVVARRALLPCLRAVVRHGMGEISAAWSQKFRVLPCRFNCHSMAFFGSTQYSINAD